MTTENLLYNDETQAADAAIALTFSVFTALEPLKKLGPIVGPVWNFCDALIGLASGGYQLYYTARYAKTNHIRKNVLASADILTSALLIAATASLLSIGGPFGFAGAMWYATARSAESAYRAKQKMNLRYLFDNRLEKLEFVYAKLAQHDLSVEERQRLESVKKRLEIQLLAIAVEVYHVKNALGLRLQSDNFKVNERREYTHKYQKLNTYHEYFNTTINTLGQQQSADNIAPDSKQSRDNPYSQFQTAYTRNTRGESTVSSLVLEEEDEENPQSTTAEAIASHLFMPREKSRAITQYLYNKQHEKYVAKTRATLIWGCASIGMTLMAVSIACPYTAPILAPIGLSFCLAVAALKTYDLYQDFSDWRARCRLEKQVLSKMTQASTVDLEDSAPLVTPEDNPSLDLSSSTASLSGSASSSSIADANADIITAPSVAPPHIPTPSRSARLFSFFSRTPLPEGFEKEVRQEAVKRCKKYKVINPELDDTTLGNKDFEPLKTLAGRFPTDDETQAGCSIFSCFGR